jgi:uncharacterized protein
MNDEIFEAVLTTCSTAGEVHVAPMGVRYLGEHVVLMPFKPSTTLSNILATQHAVLNLVLDPRVFAGCVTGRKNWPTQPTADGHGARLDCALAHVGLTLHQQQDDAQRPVLLMSRGQTESHASFVGFNRAQAAVIEGAVLVSRLHLLPPAKIDSEMAYLQIAIDKTAGPQTHEAWGWLQDAVAQHRAGPATTEGGR